MSDSEGSDDNSKFNEVNDKSEIYNLTTYRNELLKLINKSTPQLRDVLKQFVEQKLGTQKDYVFDFETPSNNEKHIIEFEDVISNNEVVENKPEQRKTGKSNKQNVPLRRSTRYKKISPKHTENIKLKPRNTIRRSQNKRS